MARAYTDALGLSALYVTHTRGRVRVCCGEDPSAALKALRKLDRRAKLHLVGWARADHAEMLMQFIRGGRADVGEAIAAVTGAIERSGIELRTDEEVQSEAATAIAHIEAEFERMMAAGELRDLNRRYRAHRLACAIQGKGAVSYNSWIATYKLELVRSTAAEFSRSPRAIP